MTSWLYKFAEFSFVSDELCIAFQKTQGATRHVKTTA